MNRILLSTILVAAAALAGCDQTDHNITVNDLDDQANATGNEAAVQLPPAITAQKAYRCKDNSLIYVDWLSDGTARVKAARNEVGTPATAEDLKGDAKAASVTVNGKSCHV